MKTLFGRVMLFFYRFSPLPEFHRKQTGLISLLLLLRRRHKIITKTAMLALVDVNMNKAFENFKKASEAEPNFIMPNVWMALFNFYSKDMVNLRNSLTKAIASAYKLNESETIILETLKKLMNNPIANVTAEGEKLVQL